MAVVTREKHGKEVFTGCEHRIMILITGGGGDFSIALNVNYYDFSIAISQRKLRYILLYIENRSCLRSDKRLSLMNALPRRSMSISRAITTYRDLTLLRNPRNKEATKLSKLIKKDTC